MDGMQEESEASKARSEKTRRKQEEFARPRGLVVSYGDYLVRELEKRDAEPSVGKSRPSSTSITTTFRQTTGASFTNPSRLHLLTSASQTSPKDISYNSNTTKPPSNEERREAWLKAERDQKEADILFLSRTNRK